MLEPVRCRRLICLGTMARWCRYASLWSDFDLTFDLAVVTLTFKFLSELYYGNHKV